jgi:putative FmdB family regulatory protein
MPLYEYKCEPCGIFDHWRSLAERDLPVICPDCEQPARRIFSPPMLLTGSFRLNKQEIREPKLVKRDREPEKPRVKSHPEGRPWMISH